MPQASTPQFAFEDGTLFIRESQREYRIRWTPEPEAKVRDAGSDWQPCEPDFRLLKPLPHEAPGAEPNAKSIAFQAFRTTIPDHLTRLAEPFTCHQWNLLRHAHRLPAVADLAGSTPILAFCLANCRHFREMQREAQNDQVLRYSHKKQKDILKWLGFPDTPAVVNLLRKIRPEAAEPSILRLLRCSIAADPDVLRTLAHLPFIHAGTLQLIVHPEISALVSPHLLHTVATDFNEASTPCTADAISQALWVRAQLPKPPPIRSLLHSKKAVQDLLEEMEMHLRCHQEEQIVVARHRKALMRERERLRRQQAAIRRAARGGRLAQPVIVLPVPPPAKCFSSFPPPPIPGTADIQPLTSPLDLAQEGRDQHHCVSLYGDLVRDGKHFAYRVLAPERCTLMIRKMPGSRWTISEVRAACNASVKCMTLLRLHEWLGSHGIEV